MCLSLHPPRIHTCRSMTRAGARGALTGQPSCPAPGGPGADLRGAEHGLRGQPDHQCVCKPDQRHPASCAEACAARPGRAGQRALRHRVWHPRCGPAAQARRHGRRAWHAAMRGRSMLCPFMLVATEAGKGCCNEQQLLVTWHWVSPNFDLPPYGPSSGPVSGRHKVLCVHCRLPC